MTVMQDVSFEVALKRLSEEGRQIAPAALAGLVSTILYSRRTSPFFVEPVIAGLDAQGRPYLCGQVSGEILCFCLSRGSSIFNPCEI